jgi:hypothetical protein
MVYELPSDLWNVRFQLGRGWCTRARRHQQQWDESHGRFITHGYWWRTEFIDTPARYWWAKRLGVALLGLLQASVRVDG